MSPYGMAIYDPREFIWMKLKRLVKRMLHGKYQDIQRLLNVFVI